MKTSSSALCRSRVVLAELVEQPGQIVRAAVAARSGSMLQPWALAVLLVVAAEEVAAPAPLLRPDDQRGGVDGLDHGGVVDHPVADFVHRRARRVDVAVGASARCSARCRGCSTARRRSRRCPSVATRCCTQACWKSEFDGTLASFGSLPVTFWPLLRMPLPASGNHCESLPVCGAVFGDREARELARFAPSLATQPIIGIGEHRLRARGLRVRDERVAALARRGAGVADALEVPVAAAVVGVQLPVVAARVVAAVAVERAVQVAQLRRGRRSATP